MSGVAEGADDGAWDGGHEDEGAVSGVGAPPAGVARRIPRLLHQTWKESVVPPALQRYVDSWPALNPGWEVMFWNDSTGFDFIRRRYPEFYKKTFPKFHSGVERADILRYLLLHHYGGVYADLDVECLRPWQPLLAKHDTAFGVALGAEPLRHAKSQGGRNLLVCNAVMLSAPGHPFWLAVIEALERVAAGGMADLTPVDSTGPVFLTRLYEEHPRHFADVVIYQPNLFYPIVDDDQKYRRLDPAKERYRETYAVHRWHHLWLDTEGVSVGLREPGAVANGADRHFQAEVARFGLAAAGAARPLGAAAGRPELPFAQLVAAGGLGSLPPGALAASTFAGRAAGGGAEAELRVNVAVVGNREPAGLRATKAALEAPGAAEAGSPGLAVWLALLPAFSLTDGQPDGPLPAGVASGVQTLHASKSGTLSAAVEYRELMVPGPDAAPEPSTPPLVFLSVRHEDGGDPLWRDTFAASVRSVWSETRAGFKAVLARLDHLGNTGWGQALRLQWLVLPAAAGGWCTDGLACGTVVVGPSTSTPESRGVVRVSVVFAPPGFPVGARVRVQLQPRCQSAAGRHFDDVHVATVTSVGPGGFNATLARVDRLGHGWGQALELQYLAYLVEGTVPDEIWQPRG
jgi:hypothetical protein